MDQDVDLLNEIRKFQMNPDAQDEPENETNTFETTPRTSTSGISRTNSSVKKNTLSTTPKRKSIKVRRNLVNCSNIDENQENNS